MKLAYCIVTISIVTMLVMAVYILGPIHSIDLFNESFSTVKDGSVFTRMCIGETKKANSKNTDKFR